VRAGSKAQTEGEGRNAADDLDVEVDNYEIDFGHDDTSPKEKGVAK
jgi:hypothetical protein